MKGAFIGIGFVVLGILLQSVSSVEAKNCREWVESLDGAPMRDTKIAEVLSGIDWTQLDIPKLISLTDPALTTKSKDQDEIPFLKFKDGHSISLFSSSDFKEALGLTTASDSNMQTLLENLGRIFRVPNAVAHILKKKLAPSSALESVDAYTDWTQEPPARTRITRLQLLADFISKRLLWLNSNPFFAARAATSNSGFEKAFFIQENRGLQKVRVLKYLPLRVFQTFAHPLRSSIKLIHWVDYRLNRHLVNANHTYPALVQGSLQTALVAQQYSELRSKPNPNLISDLPENYRLAALEQIKRSVPATGSMNVERFGIKAKASPEEIQAAEQDLATVAEELSHRYLADPKQSSEYSAEKWRILFQEGLRPVTAFARHDALITQAREWWTKVLEARKLIQKLISETEAAYIEVQKARPRSFFHAGSAYRLSCRAFAEAYLNLRAVADSLQFRIDPKYQDLYLKNAVVREEAVHILEKAEWANSTQTKTDRQKAGEQLAGELFQNTNDILNQLPLTDPKLILIRQIGQSGLFHFVGKKPWLSRIVGGLATTALLAYTVNYIVKDFTNAPPPQSSAIEVMLNTPETLRNTKAFDDQVALIVEAVKFHGLSTIDRNILLAELAQDLKTPMSSGVQKEIQSLQPFPYLHQFQSHSLRAYFHPQPRIANDSPEAKNEIEAVLFASRAARLQLLDEVSKKHIQLSPNGK